MSHSFDDAQSLPDLVISMPSIIRPDLIHSFGVWDPQNRRDMLRDRRWR